MSGHLHAEGLSQRRARLAGRHLRSPEAARALLRSRSLTGAPAAIGSRADDVVGACVSNQLTEVLVDGQQWLTANPESVKVATLIYDGFVTPVRDLDKALDETL